MPNYTHDSERWLRSNAALYQRRGNQQMARNFELCAEDVKALRDEIAALKEAAVHVYNSGYHAGHHATVEGCYVDIHPNDMGTYHAEDVAELLAALVWEE